MTVIELLLSYEIVVTDITTALPWILCEVIHLNKPFAKDKHSFLHFLGESVKAYIMKTGVFVVVVVF